MRTDVRDADATAAAGRTVTGTARALVSYALFAAGIAALASFFAPYVGLPGLAWHTSVLPTIAAPAEGDRIVNVAPLIVGVVVSSVAVWLR
jgi:xanthine/uracil permease